MYFASGAPMAVYIASNTAKILISQLVQTNYTFLQMYEL
jgi:hypothetical protein